MPRPPKRQRLPRARSSAGLRAAIGMYSPIAPSKKNRPPAAETVATGEVKQLEVLCVPPPTPEVKPG
jgi:hypothetical protein